MNNRGRKQTEETKRKLSNIMKNLHASGKHPGWKHKNEDLTRSSYPERWFRQACKNHERLSKYVVIEQLHIKKYFLDFAFVEFMVDLEIDGVQHKRPDIKLKDEKRNKEINELGWKVYRIEWKALFEDPINQLNAFADFLESSEKNIQVFVKSQKRPVKIKRNEKLKMLADERMKLIELSGIDITKYGWVGKVADLLGMKSQKIHGWMKRYHPEIMKIAFTKASPGEGAKNTAGEASADPIRHSES